MKIVCHREGLLAACQLVSVAAAAKDVNPVLRNIKAVVEPDRCTLIATDTEVGIRMEVRSIKVGEPGEALFPAARILSILREAPDDEVSIDAGPDTTMVRGKRAEFEMPGEDPSIFPDFPTFNEDKYHEATAGTLREMIRRTAFSVADAQNARYGATTGILWELEGDKVRLVATDGRRLALTDGTAQAHGGHTTAGQMPVVPLKAMTLLERNLQEPDEKVRICLHPNEALIKTERSVIYSRLTEGRFPDYKKVVPSKHPIKVPLVVGELQSAIRQASIMTDEESKSVIFSFTPKKLTLTAQGAIAGRSRIEMELDYKGDAVDIRFDPKFLLDMLKVLDPEENLTLEMANSNSAALLRNETGDYLYVVVPIALKDPKKDGAAGGG